MKTHLRGPLATALLATASCVVLAQANTAPRSDPAASPATNRSAGHYQSAFDGYRRHSDQKVQPWRDSNDLVGRIGGWQAYARESAAEAVPAGQNLHPSVSGATAASSTPAASNSAPSATPAKTPAPAKAEPSMPHHAPHGGHVTPKQP